MQRARALNDRPSGTGPVVYWMSRDQRVADNWGLLHAQRLAQAAGSHVEVVFCLQRRCGAAAKRHFDFMLGGLEEVERDLTALGIPFRLELGDARAVLPGLEAGHVVCDFAPLAPSRARRDALAGALGCALTEVDSRNVVPAWIAAEKHVYAAHNLRRRYAKLLPQFLHEICRPAPQAGAPSRPAVDWDAARAFVAAEDHGPPLAFEPGETAAAATLEDFIANRLTGYAEHRGHPDVDRQSGLSPWLHFGQLSGQRAALAVRGADAPSADIEEFIDEAVVWRDLSDNFCLYTPGYASVEGFPQWAQETLRAHAGDPRDVIYDLDAFEQADTHDALWNAAQLEMVRTGKMHNYLRMYWAKKILEWSESPEEAVRIAVLLNDRYEVDGRDPNGYTGIAWAIGSVHDRPWQERAVYGKTRYMNENGARRKFDVDAYIRRVAPELLDPQLF